MPVKPETAGKSIISNREYTKPQIREIAEKYNLATAKRKTVQGYALLEKGILMSFFQNIYLQRVKHCKHRRKNTR